MKTILSVLLALFLMLPMSTSVGTLDIAPPKTVLPDTMLEGHYQILVRRLIHEFDLDIDEYFIYGIMYTESSFRHTAVSRVGAQGILQVMPRTHKLLLKELKQTHPRIAQTVSPNVSDKYSNIVIGIYYLKHLKDYYHLKSLSQNSHLILTAYNRGPKGARQYFKANNTKSSRYSKRVLLSGNNLRKTYKENDL